MVEIKGNFGKKEVRIAGGHVEIGDIEKILKDIEETDDEFGTTSQIFNASRIAGRNHLLQASKLALEALENKNSFADSPRIELTCWAAGLRQINKALPRVGIQEGKNDVVILTIGENRQIVKKTQEKLFETLGIEENEKVPEIDDEKREEIADSFSISENQLEVASLEELVLEKVALLSLDQ